MRVSAMTFIVAGATLASSCGGDVDPTAVRPMSLVAAVRAGNPDTVGTPDLIVDQRKLESSWELGNEVFDASACETIEGGITPGTHRTLRFTVATPNIGTADIYVGDPNAHYDPNGDGDPSDGDGLFEYAPCHQHYHFRNYATYELYPVQADGSLGTPIQSAKRGFCMRDDKPAGHGSGPTGKAYYLECGAPARNGVPAIAGNQGISTGWSDIYDKAIPGQVFIVDGLAPGEYVVRIVTNPPFVPQDGEACPHTDPLGSCHMFPESNYANNTAEARITIPAP